VFYVESQTKTAGTNLYVMYKPINDWGNRDFNEIRNVSKDENGEWIGDASILRDKTKIQEVSDAELIGFLQEHGKSLKILAGSDPTNFKNEFKLSVENQNNSVSLPENDISQDEINDIIDKLDEDCK
jgi:hypothetical protein